ncbi:GrpB family protein [Oceanobacillus sp. J11TS1]|uniref:GrpB family protein n=1 Tax=Oceanobacillus sp. J11TS1 TaxID=2807191 RepID=UPI001B256A93|nr:GrpB family protein [Oceanobacillus sp. J11TS1]GIO24303.1 hypothetical protein J11TS1_28840 [Oceanobacillus sp. J11TS1]
METVNFYNQSKFKADVEKLYFAQKERILHLVPNADIQHVGSTSIPNSLTKGDIDIQVRVNQEQFTQAVQALSAVYDSNEGSVKTNEFRAFKDDATIPPLGIQLTVKGSEFDFFWKFRDVLLQNDKYRVEYDELKRNFEGLEMEAYREAKNHFFSRVMRTPEFKQLRTEIDK